MELTFDDFKERALNSKLSKFEKIGFPDSYRADTEKDIANDIFNKLALKQQEQKILDIGSGCSNLVNNLITLAAEFNHKITLIDSQEMLDNIESNYREQTHVTSIPGKFPQMVFEGQFDVIIVYSVIQYAFAHGNIFNFIHECIKRLKTNGRILIGDIPNFAKRERFLKSEDGQAFLKLGNDMAKQNSTQFDHENEERIDDAVVFSILQRFRNFGCETYLLPQAESLPFANRREDILIIKR